MTWAQDQRQAFIAEQLRGAGVLNRRDLVERFRISVPQASADIKRFMAAHPGAATYNASAKRYERKE